MNLWRAVAVIAAFSSCLTANDIADLRWTDIHWESATIGNRTVQRAALFVPVHLDGHAESILMQLDLGADLTQVEGDPYEQLFGPGTAPKDRPKPMPFTGTVAGTRFADQPFHVLPAGGTKAAPGKPIQLGTLGADFFQDRILLLDFIRQRVRILDRKAPLPMELEQKASFVPLAFRDGHFFVPISINGRPESGFFYDTGASLFTVTTTRSKWREITGRTGAESDNEIWRVPSWGKEAVLVGAHATGSIQVGRARVEKPLVFFESSGLDNLNSIHLFGNALFFDRFLVIVDVPGKRFGLLEP